MKHFRHPSILPVFSIAIGLMAIAIVFFIAGHDLLGWLQQHENRPGFFESIAGMALVAVTFSTGFFLLIRVNVRTINRTDQLRFEAEEAMQKNEKMLNRAQEIAHLGSWELDLVNNRLFWSDEVYRIFGLKPQEFKATYEAFLAAVHPDDRAAVDAAYNESIDKGNDSYEIEHRIVQKSTGAIRIVYEKCGHTRDKTGKIILSTGMVHDITERKQIENSVLNAKQEWERTFDSVPDLIAILDCDHRIKQVNKAMAQRLGQTPSECNGLLCYQAVHGMAKPPSNCPHSLLLADGHEHTADIHEDRLSGDFLVSTTPLTDAEGRMTGSVHVARDVTDLKNKERVLYEERRFIDTVIRTTGGLIIGLDSLGRIQIFNTACEKTTGYTFSEVKDRPFWDFLLLPEEVGPVKTVFGNLTGGSFPIEFENYWVTRDGSRRFVRWTNSVILDESENVELVIGTGIDITDRKMAEEELQKTKNELEILVKNRTADLQRTLEALEKERRRFNDVLEMLPAYVVLIAPDYHIPFANRFFTDQFGESGGKRCFEYLFGRTTPCEICESFKPFTTRSPHRWEWTGPNGRIYDIYDYPFADIDGSPLVMEMGIDITDRKRAEAQLMEANEMKLLGQLTSGVAHEVRNPLNGIMAIMGALLKELSDEERFQPYMRHMRTQVTRLTVLMEDLLAMGRPLREENLDEIVMETFVEKTVATWLQTLQSSKPAVRFIKPEGPQQCLIRADGTSMTQVIINLLENAFNHSPSDAEIVCSVRITPQNRVAFTVRDAGTGIPEEILPKIFDPFFTTRKGGTGLGLNIVERIVDNHHGTISAFNNTGGPGATFEIMLPLYIRDSSAAGAH